MILEGMLLTIEVAVLSLLIAVILGFFGALAKLSRFRTARIIATIYTTLIRGIPDLVLMTIIFFGGQILVNNIGDYMSWEYIDISPFIAGTVMSIKEKKTTKGNAFAIVKFSDLSKVYELFLFSEILELNREQLKEGKSFLLTVIKDKENQENRFRRINVRKILSFDKITKYAYDNVEIHMNNADYLENLYEAIKEKGNSKIKIAINNKDKNYLFELRDKRKFDYDTLKYLNKEHYIKKISF